MEEISESRSKITQISKIYIKIQLPQNEFLRGIFENLDVDYQMLGNYGSNEPLSSP